MPNYTTEVLLQYLYHETSTELSLAIEKALQTDWSLQEKIKMLKLSMNRLDKMAQSPRPQAIMSILNYARTSEVVEQS